MESSELTRMEYGDRYNFYYDFAQRQVICTTFYRGQTIRGVAKCDSNDVFDSAVGRKLAYLRCRQKLLKKKVHRATQERQKAEIALVKAEKVVNRTSNFVANTISEYSEVTQVLADLEASLAIRGETND